MTTAPPEKSPWGMAGRLPPLGLAYVAAALEKSGFQVEIYDNYLLERSIEEVKSEVRKRSPDIVGITCNSLAYERCLEMAKQPRKHILLVGLLSAVHTLVHASNIAGAPGDRLRSYRRGRTSDGQACHQYQKRRKNLGGSLISGVACKIGDEVIKSAPQFISDLDSVPFPARHLLPMRMYDRALSFLTVKPVDTMSIHRGCPYKCTYCETRQLWGTACRAFSPQRVIDEIKHMTRNLWHKRHLFRRRQLYHKQKTNL